MFLWLQLVILSVTVHLNSCWMYFTTMTDLQLSNSNPTEDVRQHSEYLFGDCRRKDIRYYTRTHLNHIDILGKVIVRGWIDVPRIPTCIRLQARSYEEDTFRSTAFNFQFCVPRMSYCHSQNRWVFFFYEWYIPLNYEGGMNWDLYFFGPRRKWW